MPDPTFLNRTLWIDDNLPVLRGINSECIDLIWLDPPFNSKRFYHAHSARTPPEPASTRIWRVFSVLPGQGGYRGGVFPLHGRCGGLGDGGVVPGAGVCADGGEGSVL